MAPQQRAISILIIILIAFLFPACTKPEVKVYPVEGQVLLDGKPAARVQVTFHPTGTTDPDAPHPVGKTDEQGRFKLTTRTTDDGAPAGTYHVTLTRFHAVKVPGDSDYATTNDLPARYAGIGSSLLSATVKEGTNTLEPITLKKN